MSPWCHCESLNCMYMLLFFLHFFNKQHVNSVKGFYCFVFLSRKTPTQCTTRNVLMYRLFNLEKKKSIFPISNVVIIHKHKIKNPQIKRLLLFPLPLSFFVCFYRDLFPHISVPSRVCVSTRTYFPRSTVQHGRGGDARSAVSGRSGRGGRGRVNNQTTGVSS